MEKLKEDEEFKLDFANIPLHIKGISGLIKTMELMPNLLESLSEISLKNTIFDSNSMSPFCEVFKNAKQLKMFDFSENDHITSSNKIDEIFSLISFFPSLTTIKLSEMELDDQIAKPLFESLLKLKHLNHIDLSNNKLTNQSLPLIRKLISTNLSIQVFHLQNNAIDEKEVNLLKEIISNKRTKSDPEDPRISLHLSTESIKKPSSGIPSDPNHLNLMQSNPQIKKNNSNNQSPQKDPSEKDDNEDSNPTTEEKNPNSEEKNSNSTEEKNPNPEEKNSNGGEIIEEKNPTNDEKHPNGEEKIENKDNTPTIENQKMSKKNYNLHFLK